MVQVGDKPVAVFNVGGRFLAISNTCLHQGGYLGLGTLDGTAVTCSRHGWQFDVASGECLSRPGRAVESYEVRVEDGQVQVLA